MGIIGPVPIHLKQWGSLSKWGSHCTYSASSVSAIHSDLGLHDELDANSSPTRHQQRVNKKSMLMSHSKGKLGVQINRCAFSTLTRDKVIKQKHSPSDDRKWIESFHSQVVDYNYAWKIPTQMWLRLHAYYPQDNLAFWTYLVCSDI